MGLRFPIKGAALMSITAGVGGVNRQVKQVFTGVSGVNREIQQGYAGVSGVNRPIFANAIDLTILGGAEDTGCWSRIYGNTTTPARPSSIRPGKSKGNGICNGNVSIRSSAYFWP